jgi:hypothetical protein
MMRKISTDSRIQVVEARETVHVMSVYKLAELDPEGNNADPARLSTGSASSVHTDPLRPYATRPLDGPPGQERSGVVFGRRLAC